MNDFREDILSKLLLLGEGIKGSNISELNKENGFKDNHIKSDLLTFDYSTQRISNEVLDYFLQIPYLINHT